MCKHCELSKPIGFIDLETNMLHSIYIEERNGFHTPIQRVTNIRTGVISDAPNQPVVTTIEYVKGL